MRRGVASGSASLAALVEHPGFGGGTSQHRPHRSLKGLSPREFARVGGGEPGGRGLQSSADGVSCGPSRPSLRTRTSA